MVTNSTTTLLPLPLCHQLQVMQGTTTLHGSCTEVMAHLPPALQPFLHGRLPGQGSSLLPTVFRLAHHCEWGERYGLLGSVAHLGNWDPAKAVPMKVSCCCLHVGWLCQWTSCVSMIGVAVLL